MAYRLLLDENVEHEVGYRLENYGHDVEHVDFVPDLGKGTDDRSLADYSTSEGRVIVTYDDDFVLELDEREYRAVLYVPDASLSCDTVADVVNEVATYYPQRELDGVVHVGSEWL